MDHGEPHFPKVELPTAARQDPIRIISNCVGPNSHTPSSILVYKVCIAAKYKAETIPAAEVVRNMGVPVHHRCVAHVDVQLGEALCAVFANSIRPWGVFGRSAVDGFVGVTSIVGGRVTCISGLFGLPRRSRRGRRLHPWRRQHRPEEEAAR